MEIKYLKRSFKGRREEKKASIDEQFHKSVDFHYEYNLPHCMLTHHSCVSAFTHGCTHQKLSPSNFSNSYDSIT
jgi:hypothetical protein